MRSFKQYINEKKLTQAELKKREEVAQAIKRDNPDMPMDKKMAIATATAKRVAEVLGLRSLKAKGTVKEEACCEECKYDHEITEATHQGKTVKLNDPIRTSEVPSKKFKVYVKDGDKIKVVRFGDPGLSIKRDDPNRRKSFRARHNCDNPGPKTKARYWSCYQWRSGSKVDS